MDYDFLRKNQRSKRAWMKQILQMMLLLLVCVWLLYQINQLRANYRKERFGGEITIFEEHEIVLFGRKVMIPSSSSWLNQIPHSVAESENRTEEESKSESDQEVGEINDEKDETDRFYRFHDENGVPPEEGDETEAYGGNRSDSSLREEKIINRLGDMNTHEAVLFSGDVNNDVEGNSESIITHSDTSGIGVGYSPVL